MAEEMNGYKDVLIEERDVLTEIIERQNELRKAVKDMLQWKNLLRLTSGGNSFRGTCKAANVLICCAKCAENSLNAA